jgi:hypothetical protein
MSQVITQASREWATRPDDQRYLSLADLRAAVHRRRSESWTAAPRLSDLRVLPQEGDDIGVQVYDPAQGKERLLHPTNWGFNNLSQFAGAPSSYLRTLPAEIAAINLQWGIENKVNDALILAQSNGDNVLRAVTSTSYGRIWDEQVVDAVANVNDNGRWVVPAASYTANDPKRATTLYASDRDVFIFLVDPNHPIEVPGESAPKYRGFYMWNSEVGAAVCGFCTFLYDHVCDNRTIWGATDIKELRIRHTGGAPERFAYEGGRLLLRYSEESSAKIVESIVKAKSTELEEAKKPEDLTAWLAKRGFTKSQAKASIDSAKAERGQCRTVWDVVNGVTGYARSITHTDQRVDLESKAGKIMADLTA